MLQTLHAIALNKSTLVYVASPQTDNIDLVYLYFISVGLSIHLHVCLSA